MDGVRFDINTQIRTDLSQYKNHLKQLIDETDVYYRVLHESIPIIERNIELTEQETNILMDYFVETSSSTQEETQDEAQDHGSDNEQAGQLEGQDFLIIRILGELEREFQHIGSFLLNEGEIDDILKGFSTGKTSEDSTFDKFIYLIKDIEKILLKVDEIAYNAIIFSARLGAEGKGFHVISDNLKRTSSTLSTDLSYINQSIDELGEWYDKFKDSIDDIVDKREQAVKQYIERLDTLFNSILESMQTISSLLRDLLKHVMASVTPFQELMNLIQRQDIVRQNLENLIETTGVIEGKYSDLCNFLEGDPSQNVVLDHIVFVRKGLDLARQLEGNIREQLIFSLNDIKSITKSLMEDLSEVRGDAQHISDFLTGASSPEEIKGDATSQGGGAVGYTFINLFEFLKDFTVVLDTISDAVLKLNEQKGSFDSTITKLSDDIGQIHKRVGFLKKIKLLANIELSRMTGESKAVGQNMDAVISQVDQKVSDNHKIFTDLKNELQQDINRFDQIIVENQTSINNSLDKVKYSKDRLETTSDIISKAVMALYKEIDALYQQLHKVDSQLQSTGPMDDLLEQMSHQLDEITQATKKEEEKILAHLEISDWEAKSTELKDLFSRFTTYLERVTAKSLFSDSDEALDEGSSEGELTLF